MNEDMMTPEERRTNISQAQHTTQVEPAPRSTGEHPGRGRGLYYVHTLGCQMNVHDSERIAGVMEENGYRPASEEQFLAHDVDVVIMNTCAVRENATERMYGTIGKWKRFKYRNPHAQIAIGGCMAQLDRERIAKRTPWVDAVFGTKNIEDLPALLDQARAAQHTQVKVNEDLTLFPSQLPAHRASAHSAWVAISMGCNNTCTFCIVPTTPWQGARPQTGRRTRRDPRDGDERGEGDHAAGAECELVWLWHRRPLCVLQAAARCGEIEGLERVRFTSPHPAAFTDDVIAAMAETPNVMHQLHFPAAIRIRPHLARHAPLIPFREVPGHSREDS